MSVSPSPCRLIALTLTATLAVAAPSSAFAQTEPIWGEGEEPGLRRLSAEWGPFERGAPEPVEIDALPIEEIDAPTLPPPEPDDPYAPLGVRAGSFVLFPSVEARIGYSDNLDQLPQDGASGAYTRIIPELAFESDWSRHGLRGRIGAEHRRDFAGAEDRTTAFDAELVGRLDVDSATTAELAGHYSRAPERRGEPGVPTAVVDPPVVERYGGRGQIDRDFGRLRLGLRGLVEHESHSTAVLGDGTIIDNRDRDHLASEGAVRAGYEAVEGRALFVEGGVTRRRFDRRIDRHGRVRGSRGEFILAGIELRPDGPLSGEVAAGYQRQRPDDPGLADFAGPMVRGVLEWEATALTTFRLTGGLEAEESVLDADASGARAATIELGLDHALRRNLLATAGLAYSRWNYVGSPRRETWKTASLGLEYLANRSLSFIAEGGHRRLESNIAGEGYDETWVEFGVRVRR